MPRGTIAKLLKVAWWSIGLGITIEILIVVAALILNQFQGGKPVLADLLQKITWSTLVCVGLAFGKAISNASPAVTGTSGFLVAPLAFTLARSVHRSVAQMLGLVAANPPGTLLFTLGALKAVEYAVLGFLLSRLDGHPASTFLPHVKRGIVVGVIFGTAILSVMGGMSVKVVPLVEWISRGINEIIFPVGCSIVLYAAGLTGRMLPK